MRLFARTLPCWLESAGLTLLNCYERFRSLRSAWFGRLVERGEAPGRLAVILRDRGLQLEREFAAPADVVQQRGVVADGVLGRRQRDGRPGKERRDAHAEDDGEHVAGSRRAAAPADDHSGRGA